MILGANPQELDQLAARISQRADAYEHAHQQITYWLNRLSWQGPDAHRFRAAYRSSMGPQLVDAAAALRDAASRLRSQAAQQRMTSSSPSGVGPTGPSLAALLGVGGLGGSAGALHLGKTRFESQEKYSERLEKHLENFLRPWDFIEIGAAAWAPAELDNLGLLFHADKLDDFGLARIFGGGVGSDMSVIGTGFAAAGAAVAVATLPGDLGDLHDDIAAFDWNDQDSIEQFFYSGTDVMISTGSMMGVTPWAPAGLVLISTGYVMKGGTAVLPPVVDWGVDNVVWPMWDKVGRSVWDSPRWLVNSGVDNVVWPMWDKVGRSTWDFATNDVPELIGGAVGGATDFVGDVAEGSVNVVRDMGQSSRQIVGNVANGVRDFLGF